MTRPGPWCAAVVSLRLAGLALAATGAAAGGAALLAGGWGALSLLRVPRGRVALEVLLAAGVGDALAPGPRWPWLVAALLAAAWLLLAPEAGAYPLNGLDRYFVAQDYPGARINSHHVVDTRDALDHDALVLALGALMAEAPLARSFVREAALGAERFFALAPFVDPADLVERRATPLETDDGWAALDAPFDLARRPPLRVVHAPREGGGWRLALTVHHSAVDGAGGLLLLDRLLRHYLACTGGAPPPPPFVDPGGRRLRDVLRPRGRAWLLRMIWRHARPLDKVGVRNASLLDDETARPAGSRHRLAALPADDWRRLGERAATLGLTRNDLLLAAVLRAADAWRQARGKDERPFRVLLPTDLRATLGLPPRTLQNVVGVVRADFTLAEVRDPDLPAIVSRRVKAGRDLEEAVEAPVNLGTVSALLPPWLFRRALRAFDADPRSFFFSLLWSHIRVPPDLARLPGTEAVWVRGSLVRQPGFGVVLVNDGGQATLAFEYLVPLASDEGAADLEARLLAEARAFVA
ncbi:MAG: hypothetical protein KF878_11810 [Planctomycetes bacterium]|nr:hypothetical protein [Planctomycetota bacterium]